MSMKQRGKKYRRVEDTVVPETYRKFKNIPVVSKVLRIISTEELEKVHIYSVS